jgi:hypothetical protein
MLKRLTLSLCLLTLSLNAAKSLRLDARSDFLNWAKQGRDPSSIHTLSLQDGWSSRAIDYIDSEHFQNSDFAAITQTFSHLETLTLCHNTQLTGQCLHSLRHLPALRHLSLIDTQALSDQGLLLLSLAAPQLETLSLHSYKPMLTGETFKEALNCLTRLRYLEVGSLSGLPWKKLAEALETSAIEELVFSKGYSPGSGEEAHATWSQTFSQMSQLKRVTLSFVKEDVSRILLTALNEKKTSLEHLTLAGSSLTTTPLPKQLKSLTIRGYFFHDDHVAAVTNLILLAKDLPALETLEIHSQTYIEDPLLKLEELMKSDFSSLKKLHLLSSSSYPFIKEIGLRIKRERPDLHLFVDYSEIDQWQ